jgi:hypothetical protein
MENLDAQILLPTAQAATASKSNQLPASSVGTLLSILYAQFVGE